MIHYLFYDSTERQLRLQFDRQEVYDYFLVPPEVAREAEVAFAGGNSGFFRAQIRGIYPTRRVA